VSIRGQKIFSGEPLPVPPKVSDPEVDAFHRKLIDYLRRLAGKLGTYVDDNPTGGANVTKAFIAYPSETNTPDNAYSATSENIRWQNILRSDSIYTYDSTFAFIEVSEAGTYIVHCDVLTSKNFDTSFDVVISDGTGGIDPATPSYVTTYPFLSGSPSGDSWSFMCPLILTANQRIGVRITTVDQVLQHEGTRLVIEKLEDEA